MSVFTSDGTENLMRWDRRSRGFMEVWYSTVTHRATGAGVWLRYTLTSPLESVGPAYCELWGFLFDPEGKRAFAAKERWPIDRLGPVQGRDDGAIVRIGDSWLSENHLEGTITNGDGRLRWSLDFDPAERCFQHLPAPIRKRVEDRISTVCSPNLSVPFTGTLELNDEIFGFEGEPGCQSHRWGRRHSQTWAWGHCATFEEDDSALFEGVAAKSKLGPLPGPTLTFIYLNFGGEDLAFNEMRSILRARSRYEMPTWAFTASNSDSKIVGAARARLDRLVQVEYADPDGSPRYCANSEIGDLAIEVYGRTSRGWRHRGSLTAMGSSHVEFGRPEPYAELAVSF